MEWFGKISAMSSGKKKNNPQIKKIKRKRVRENRFYSRKSGHLSFGPTPVCNGIIGAK